jgi:hypothetical protein
MDRRSASVRAAWRKAIASDAFDETATRPLLLPARRPILKHLGQPQRRRLPVEDRLDCVRREAGDGGKRRT